MSDLPPQPAPRPQRVRGEELRRRIELVKSSLLSGKSREWVSQLITTEWGLQPSQRCKYIRQAEAEIREVVEKNAQGWLAEHVAIRRDIRRRANDQADLKMELAAADSEAKLLGLLDGKSPPAPPSGDDGRDGSIPVREIVVHLTGVPGREPGPGGPTGGPGPDGQSPP